MNERCHATGPVGRSAEGRVLHMVPQAVGCPAARPAVPADRGGFSLICVRGSGAHWLHYYIISCSREASGGRGS